MHVDASTTFAFIIDLHIRDLAEVGKPLLRGKAYCLEKLKADLGSERLTGLTRERIIAYTKQRAKLGAGAATIGMDIGYIRTILVHAAAVSDILFSWSQLCRRRGTSLHGRRRTGDLHEHGRAAYASRPTTAQGS